MGTEGRINRLEKQVTQNTEITNWVAINLYDGQYSTLDRKQISEEEYQELAKQPGVGLIIINRVDTPIPQED